MAACRRTARTRANTCLGCWESVSIYFISLTFVSFLYEPPELTSPQTTTNWPTWPKWFMISFLLFGSLSFFTYVPFFLLYKKLVSTTIAGYLNSKAKRLKLQPWPQHLRKRRKLLICWLFFKLFSNLDVFFPLKYPSLKRLWRKLTNNLEIKDCPTFQLSARKNSIPSTRTFLSSLTHHPGATASATGCCSHPPDAPRRRQPPRPSKKRRRSKGLATWLACWVG